MPLQQFDERNALNLTLFLDSTATPNTWVPAIGSNNGDFRLDVLQVSNNDTIPHNVAFTGACGDDNCVIAEVEVPAGAGYGTAPPIDVLAQTLPTGYHYWLGYVGDTWNWTVREAIGSGAKVRMVGIGGTL